MEAQVTKFSEHLGGRKTGGKKWGDACSLVKAV
jgi:hypothetical protein